MGGDFQETINVPCSVVGGRCAGGRWEKAKVLKPIRGRLVSAHEESGPNENKKEMLTSDIQGFFKKHIQNFKLQDQIWGVNTPENPCSNLKCYTHFPPDS